MAASSGRDAGLLSPGEVVARGDFPTHLQVEVGYTGQHEHDSLLADELLTVCCARKHRVLVAEDKAGARLTIGSDLPSKFLLIGSESFDAGGAGASAAQATPPTDTTEGGSRLCTAAEVMQMALPVVIRPHRPGGVARRNRVAAGAGGANIASSALRVLAVQEETLLIGVTVDSEVVAIPVEAPAEGSDQAPPAGDELQLGQNTELARVAFRECSGADFGGGPAVTAVLGRVLPVIDLGLVRKVGCPLEPGTVSKGRRRSRTARNSILNLSDDRDSRASEEWLDKYRVLEAQVEAVWLEFASYKHQLREKMKVESKLSSEIERLNEELVTSMRREQSALASSTQELSQIASDGPQAALIDRWKSRMAAMKAQVQRMWEEYGVHKQLLAEKTATVQRMEGENASLWEQVEALMLRLQEEQMRPSTPEPASDGDGGAEEGPVTVWREKMVKMKDQLLHLYQQFQVHKLQLEEKNESIAELRRDNDRLRHGLESAVLDTLNSPDA